MTRPAVFVIALAMFSVSADRIATAQSPASNASGVTASESNNGTRRVTLTRAVEPSFHIEPIVQRFEARRGAVIPFTFEIASTGKDMNVEVEAVNLRQEETGIIMHDDDSQANTGVEFTSDTEFQLAPGEKFKIEGTVTVPLARTNFLSYGILVRDNGVSSDSSDGDDDGEAINAAVKFVTQYVLRIDIETGVREIAEMGRLQLNGGEVITQSGLPVASIYLDNPTDFAFELQVRGKPESRSNKRPRPFFLTMQSRASLDNEERTLIRIMPKARLKLVAPLDSYDISSLESINVAVTNGRREVVEESFALNALNNRFPALEPKIASLPGSVSIEPAQIEIGRIAGTDRTCALQVRNSGEDNQELQLELFGLDGNPIQGVRVSSDDFVVKAGRTKTIRLSLQSSREELLPEYGMLKIRNTRTPDQVIGELPVALLHTPPQAPQVRVSDLALAERDGHRVFELTATNNGVGYAPVHGKLVLSSKQGWTIHMEAGYGIWLKPGESKTLEFIPDRTLENARYQLAYEVRTNDAAKPHSRSLVVDLGSSDPDAADAAAQPQAAAALASPDALADANQ